MQAPALWITILGLCLLAVAILWLWRRSRHAASGPSAKKPPASSPAASEYLASGLSKTDAEELLDWYEAHGQTGWKLEFVEGEGYAVRRA